MVAGPSVSMQPGPILRFEPLCFGHSENCVLFWLSFPQQHQQPASQTKNAQPASSSIDSDSCGQRRLTKPSTTKYLIRAASLSGRNGSELVKRNCFLPPGICVS